MARLLILDTGNASLSMAIKITENSERNAQRQHVSYFKHPFFSDHLNLENWAQHINMKD